MDRKSTLRSTFSRRFSIVSAGLGLVVWALNPAKLFAQTLPQLDVHTDPAGQFANYQPRGDTPETGAFFQSLGTNGRTCQTCHQPADAFGLGLSDIKNTFTLSNGNDPLFAAVDGADCIDSKSHNMLVQHGLIRILLPIFPTTASGATPQFTVTVTKDPTNCQLSNPNVQAQCQAQYGPGFQCISVYRRPLPTTNLTFQSAVMWDGREPSAISAGLTASLTKQATDATLTHAQASSAPTAAQLADIVNFETGIYTAQMTDNRAVALDALGATENPENLPAQPFFFGINGNLKLTTFNENVFTVYDAWSSLTGTDPISLARESIARGETIFNTRALTDPFFPHPATCSNCHNDPNLGNNSNNPLQMLKDQVDNPASPVLKLGYLPTFALQCNGQKFVSTTTDPGTALITGNCSDIGAFKTPTLHGLSARPPFFHNGSAVDLATVVQFYNAHFNMGLSNQDESDLVNFLNTL